MEVLRLLFQVPDDAPALGIGVHRVDHGTFRSRVVALADRMTGAGLRAGDRVALALPHGLLAPTALWACWMARLVPVPIDTHLPPERVRKVLDRAGASLLLAEGARGESLVRRLDGSCPAWLDVGFDDAPEQPRAVEAMPTWAAEDPALLLFTSGSTGEPKGVTVPARAIDAFALHWGGSLSFRPGVRIAWAAALSFDLSLLDLVGGLAFGAEVHPIPEALLAFPEQLVPWLAQREITHLYTVPSLWVRLLDHGLAGGSVPLRAALYAGEPMAAADARRFRAALPSVPLWNLFGPTETNVNTAYEVPAGFDAAAVPIGRPMPYLEVALVDEVGRVGDEGEMLCRGGTTMLGYWGEPGRARWLGDGSDRWLRTGDRARRRDDGVFEFLGRMDRMAKIDGYRVEPEEVETHAGTAPGVTEAAVVVDRSRGAPRLVLCWTGAPATGSVAVLMHVRRKVPPYAVPAAALWLESLPRTERGKVDLQRLAELVASIG